MTDYNNHFLQRVSLVHLAGQQFQTCTWTWQVLLAFTLAKYEAPTYGDYHYDTFATVFGWIVASISFIPIPVVAGWMLYRARGSLIQVVQRNWLNWMYKTNVAK